MIYNGVVNVLKPPGMTSHDVVNVIRKVFNTKKVGHTGTLDPAAAGVLPICVGRATKIAQYITGADKEYRAEITFGITTDTQDAEGVIINNINASHINEQSFIDILKGYEGIINQIPPMASAVKIKGKKLYELQRSGKQVERPARKVEIYSTNLVWATGWGTSQPRAIFDVSCSKGTYIRTLCHDIGEKLGVGAHMSFLLRTAVGEFRVNESLTLEELKGTQIPENAILSINKALAKYPQIKVRDNAIKSILSGAKLYPPGILQKPDNLWEGCLVRLTNNDDLLALAEVQMEKEPEQRLVLKPICIIKID